MQKDGRAQERELETKGFVDRRKAEQMTVRMLLGRFQREVVPGKKSAPIETIKINVILKDGLLAGLKLTSLTSAQVSAWRDRRLQGVSGGTVNREIDILSAAINHARREWDIHIENPIPLVKRPAKARARSRRFSKQEETYLLCALSRAPRRADGTFDKSARNPWFVPVVKFALETAMRRGELLALEWQHIDLKRRTAHLPDTKNREPRTVPLSTRAVKILRALPVRTSSRVFPLSPMALRKGFARALERARARYVEDCAAAKRTPEEKISSCRAFSRYAP